MDDNNARMAREFCGNIEFMIYENRVKSASDPIEICNHRIGTAFERVRPDTRLPRKTVRHFFNLPICLCTFVYAM